MTDTLSIPRFANRLNVALPSERTKLFTYAYPPGGDSRAPGIRRKIFEHKWTRDDDLILRNSHFSSVSEYGDALNSSRFWIVPPGDVGWSADAWEALFAGSIPVIIASNTTFPFDKILNYTDFTVQIPIEEVQNDPGVIEQTLRVIPLHVLETMHDYALAVRSAFIYTQDRRPGDPFDLISIMLRIKRQLLEDPRHAEYPHLVKQ